MALTGSFLADFTSFYDAAQQADVHLKGMETNANKVESSLNKMVDSFSGRKLAQDATLMVEAIERMGGVTKLTEAEQAKVNRTVTEAIAKYKALGMEAPPELQKVEAATRGAGKTTADWSGAVSTMSGVLGAMGVQLSVGALVSWVGTVTEAAGHVGDLAQQLGVSTDAVQRWDYAAKMGGATIDDVEKSVVFMNKALSGGDDSTQAALERVGLSFAAVRGMGTEKAFEAITEGLRTIPDPALRTRTEFELLGKSGIALGTAIDDGMKEVGDSTNVMSRETIRALKDAGDAWEGYKNRLIIASAEGIDGILHLGDRVKEGLGTAVQFSADVWTSGLAGAVVQHNAAAAKITQDINEVHAAEDAAASAAAARNAEAAAQIEATEAKRKRAQAESDAAQKKAAAEVLRQAQEIAALNEKMFGIDLVEKAAKYAQALDGIGNVGRMTKEAQAELNTVMTAAYGVLLKAGEGASAAAQEYRALQLATTDWAAINKTLAASTDAQEDTFWAKRQERHRVTLTNQLDVFQGLRDTSGAYVETAAEAAASGEAANAAMLQAVNAIHGVPPAAGEAVASVNRIAQSFETAGSAALTMADKVERVMQRMDLQKAYDNISMVVPSMGGDIEWYNLQENRRAGLSIGPYQYRDLPQLSEGGLGNFGSGTPVMLHGQEAIVPLDRAGGALGGTTANVTIHINGAVDPARAGRDAAEALVQYMKSRGVRI